jgi:hypothetical protein
LKAQVAFLKQFLTRTVVLQHVLDGFHAYLPCRTAQKWDAIPNLYKRTPGPIKKRKQLDHAVLMGKLKIIHSSTDKL